MIEPTEGRIVHFYPHRDAAPDQRPFAAMLAGINDNGTINLTVSARDGSTYAVQNVPLLQGNDAPPPYGHFAAWMPFQKAQAARTDVAEGPLAGKLDALEKATEGKFLELGKYLETKLGAIETRLAGVNEHLAPPAPSTDGGGQQQQPS